MILDDINLPPLGRRHQVLAPYRRNRRRRSRRRRSRRRNHQQHFAHQIGLLDLPDLGQSQQDDGTPKEEEDDQSGGAAG